MALFTWEERYSVSLDRFDRQHKELVRIMNDLYDAMRQNTASSGDVVARLIAYTEEHFQSEEALMREHGYPGLAVHEAEHKRLVEQVADYQKRLASNPSRVTVEMLLFLKNWLGGHILGLDKAYSDFFSGKGIH